MAIPDSLTGEDRAAFDICMAAFRRLHDRIDLSQAVSGDVEAREEIRGYLNTWHNTNERPAEIDSEFLSTIATRGHER